MKNYQVLLAILIIGGVFVSARAQNMNGMKMDHSIKSKPLTVTGLLVDSSCYLEDGATNNDHDGMIGCGTKCLDGGSPAGLLVGKKLYTLVFPAPVFENYVGKKVEVVGRVYLGDQLIPEKAFVIKNGAKEEIKIAGKSMM